MVSTLAWKEQLYSSSSVVICDDDDGNYDDYDDDDNFGWDETCDDINIWKEPDCRKSHGLCSAW